MRIGRIAGPALPAPVEGEEPRRLALEVGAEVDFVLVDREVRHAAPEPKEGLAPAAVAPVLQDRVPHRLLREAVLELEGEDGKPVDEEADVERALALVAAVAELAGDGEAVLAEALPGRPVLRGRCAVVQTEVVGAVPDAVPENIDRSALGDLALEAGEEIAPGRAILAEAEGGGGVGLGGAEERVELDEIDAVLAVVVVVVAGGPSDAAVSGRRARRRCGRRADRRDRLSALCR